MACPLPCRKAPDGTKVAIIVLDNVNADRIYRTAADLRVEWDGDPDDLGPCICPPATYSCTASAETASIGATAENHVIQQRELVRGQLGRAVTAAFIGDDTDINPGDNPITIPIPAHAANSVLVLHMGYGGEDRSIAAGADTISDPTVTLSGSDATTLTPLWEVDPDAPINDVGGFVFYMNGVTGNAGSSLTVDFAQWDIPATGNKPGTVQWVLKEYTSNLGALTVADFDLANAVSVVVDPSTNPTDVANPPVRSHAPVDLGPCDGTFYAIARHVREDNDDGTDFYDADWATMPTDTGGGYEELYDLSSIDRATVCQLGITSGLVRGGNGPTAYGYQQNYHWSQFTGEQLSAGVFVPMVHETATADDQFEEMCEVVAVNHCPGDAVSVMCRLVAEVEMTVEAGDTLTVTPFINGVAITSAAQTVTTSGTVSIDASAAGANIPDGGADTTHTFYLELSGVGSASANAWEATCTTTQL